MERVLLFVPLIAFFEFFYNFSFFNEFFELLLWAFSILELFFFQSGPVLFDIDLSDSGVFVEFIVFRDFDFVFGIENFLRFFNYFFKVFEPLDEDSGNFNRSNFYNTCVKFSASCRVFGNFSTDFEVGINGLNELSEILIISVNLIHDSVEQNLDVVSDLKLTDLMITVLILTFLLI